MKHPINTPVTFPRKLYDLIESESSDIVDWAEHGLAFVVKQPDAFTQEILPKYFRHTKLTSFQRQLNLYGFRRITKGPDQGAYFHPHFQRAKRELLGQIKRLPGKGAMSTPPPKSLYQAAGLHHYAATQGPGSGRVPNQSGSDFNMRMNRPANITTRAQARMTNRDDDNSDQLYEPEEVMMHRHQQQMYAAQQQQQYVQFHQNQAHHQQPPQNGSYGFRPMADPHNGYQMQFNTVPGQMMNMGGQSAFSNPQGYHVHSYVSSRPAQPMVSAPMLAPMPSVPSQGSFKDMTRLQGEIMRDGTPSPRSTTSFSPNDNADNSLAIPVSRPLMMSNMGSGFSQPMDTDIKPSPTMMQVVHSQQQDQQQNSQQPLQSSQMMGTGVPVPKSSLMRNVSTNSELWSIPSELGDLEFTDLDNLFDPNDPNAQGMTHIQFAAAAENLSMAQPSVHTLQAHSSPLLTSSDSMVDEANTMEMQVAIESKLLV